MSDYQDQYQYEQPEEQMGEENVETTLQFQNFNAEQLLRDKKYPQALSAFQAIYQKACDHNILGWKTKVLTQLLQIYVHLGNGQEARKTLHTIRQMNELNKTNQQAVKSIIKALIAVQRKMYESFWDDIFALIKSLDDLSSQLKCYFLMFEKQIQMQNLEKSKPLYKIINDISSKVTQIPSSLELEMLYLQILYLKMQKEPYKHILKNIYIKLPNYENDTNTNETFLSKVKQQIAESLYKQENYVECANFLCECFIQNSTSGTNTQKNKQLLKINTLMIFLCGNLELLENSGYNPMLQSSTAIFKTDADIQSLYGLISAFKEQNIVQFEQVLKVVNLNLPANSPYADLQKRVLLELRKQKLYSMCKSYKNIKFEYIQRRLNEPNASVIQSMLFSLIASERINGIIHLQDKYLQILPDENKYYTVQLQNLKDMTEKM